MSEQPEFFTYTREEFLEEFVHPDDRAAVEDARQRRALKVRSECLTEMRKQAGLTQRRNPPPIPPARQLPTPAARDDHEQRHRRPAHRGRRIAAGRDPRSEGKTSELQSPCNL